MDSQQSNRSRLIPVEQEEVIDGDEVPQEYRDEVCLDPRAKGKARPQSQTTRRITRNQSTMPTSQPKKAVSGGHSPRRLTPTKEPQGLMVTFMGWVTPKRSSPKPDPKFYEEEHTTERLDQLKAPIEVSDDDDREAQTKVASDEVTELKQSFQISVDGVRYERETRERELEQRIHNLQHERETKAQELEQNIHDLQQERETKEREFKQYIHKLQHERETKKQELEQRIHNLQHQLQQQKSMFQTQLRESESQNEVLQNQHVTFIREQQEASFKRMDSARWLPTDEGKVMSELDKLKKDMRSWARSRSIKDATVLSSLEEAQSAALMRDLANVAHFENGQLLKGLSTTPKGAMLLLNALLSHSVYSGLFRSPFFALKNIDTIDIVDLQQQNILDDIYMRVQETNKEDANTWRSQTLRLLMPPLKDDTSDSEKRLRQMTEESIARAAHQHASAFLASPAQFLMENNTRKDLSNKLKKIYSDAARLSYMLWTRKTAMRCLTLHETWDMVFDAESHDYDPDPLVRWEDHVDHLKGGAITLMVHPILKAYGTDEGKDYDQERVWAKGVVWLDSKNS